MSYPLINQHFQCQCPNCGTTLPLYVYTTASPSEWISSQKNNPHFRVCHGCGNGYRRGNLLWRYVGETAGQPEAEGE